MRSDLPTAAETLGAALAMHPIELPLIESGRVEAPFEPLGPLDEAIYAVYCEQQKDNPGIGAFIEWLRVQLLGMAERRNEQPKRHSD